MAKQRNEMLQTAFVEIYNLMNLSQIVICWSNEINENLKSSAYNTVK